MEAGLHAPIKPHYNQMIEWHEPLTELGIHQLAEWPNESSKHGLSMIGKQLTLIIVYMQLTGVITVSIIEHNRKKSKRNRGNFLESILGKILSIIDRDLVM